MSYIPSFSSSLLVLIIFITCGKGATYDYMDPPELDSLENLQVYSYEPDSVPNITLKKELTIGSTEEIILSRINLRPMWKEGVPYYTIATDDNGRIFISDIQQIQIQIYDSTGAHLKTLSVKGNGPGEVGSIHELVIRDSLLYIIDYGSGRSVQQYKLETFEPLSSYSLFPEDKSSHAELNNYLPYYHVKVLNDSLILLDFVKRRDLLMHEGGIPGDMPFYSVNREGKLSEEPVLTMLDSFFYTDQGPEAFLTSIYSYEFGPLSRIQISSTSKIFTNYSSDFLFKVYDEEGNYERAFYYAFPKNKATPDFVTDNEALSDLDKKKLSQFELPAYYPVVRDVIMNDDNQLLVGTYPVGSLSETNWWLLNADGEMLGQFTLTANAQIKEFNGNHIYTIQYNEKAEEDQVTRYALAF